LKTRQSNRKGIILGGGAGTRLHPVMMAVGKRLVPVYDKPMVYFPLSTLMPAGIREYLVLTTPRDERVFRALLGDGSQWGLAIDYAIQPAPAASPRPSWSGQIPSTAGPWALIVGGNIFCGQSLSIFLQDAAKRRSGATILGY
jgi:glucose-1-phosphate thymidylyltransferase